MSARFDMSEIKRRVSLSGLVGQAVTWDRRKTNAARGDFWACCPFHDERTPSFHVDDRKGFFFCFGCQAKGDHVDWLTEREGLEAGEAIRRLAGLAGLGPVGTSAAPAPARKAPRREDAEARASAERRLAMALEIWRAAEPDAPLLAAYLAARGVRVEALRAAYGGALPPTLRLAPRLEHRQGGRVIHRGPAMIGLIARDREIVGVHRTWIEADGRARDGDGAKLPKQWLGLTGAIWGAPVRFSPPTRRMIVGEGIETVLAVYSLLVERGQAGAGASDPWSAEAALSLGALAGPEDPVGRGPRNPRTGKLLPSAVPDWARAPAWSPPDSVEVVRILAEGSTTDPEAAKRHSLRAMRRHGWRAGRVSSPRVCSLALPGRWDDGLDFADLATAETA